MPCGVRVRAVPALPVDGDLDAVGGRHRRAGRDADPACGKRGPVVERVHLLGRKALEQPVVDHRLGASVAFLSGLEDEIRSAVEIARLVKITGGGEQHRRVTVVAAAVHPAVVGRPVGEVVLLLHRQRVHVGAQADRAAAFVAAPHDHGDHAGAADAGVVLDAERGQRLANDARRALLLETQLGMRVQVAADRRERVGVVADVVDGRHQCAVAMRSMRRRGSTA